uniref:Methyltransferase n=1 Tax=candidate division CPR3 bacterium TaxID=2268181 RepID=A0A7V3N4T2_UNCC3
MAMKPNEGSYAENALKWGVAGLNINEARIGIEKIQAHHAPKGTFAGGEPDRGSDTNYYTNQGRFPANVILECTCDEVKEGKEFKKKDEKRFQKTDGGIFMASPLDKTLAPDFDKGKKAIIHTNPNCPCFMLDQQQKNVSRFFYCAKASRSERNMGLEGIKKEEVIRQGLAGEHKNPQHENHHPTVKPLKLMEYLCILTKTPTGGIVLDPFAGSGTTGMACKKIGRDFILIEKEKDYCKIAEERIKNTPTPLL